MPRTLNDAAAAPAALVAFLRGVERRGAVFAQLQVGDAATGDRALIAAMRAFRLPAARIPIAEWPRQFWSLLLATGELRETLAAPHWDSGFDFLARVGRGPRAALLLRLVAGLPEADAAAVLGVARPTYRLALQRALPHRDDGQPDAEGWRMLGEASQHAVRALSVERLAHLARMREAAILGRKLEPGHASPPTSMPIGDKLRARWTGPAMAAVATLAVLAFIATFFLPLGDADPAGDGSRIEVTALPPAQAPMATFDAQTALVTHPDFDLLIADDDDAAARDPGFYAWLAAGAKARPGDTSAAAAAVPDDASSQADGTPTESEDAP
ncbi:MAG: hypothetical protein ACOH1R_11925 [Luteimonas sp.]